MRSKSYKSGFTLVEIMIAVMILGLLAAMSTPAVLRARDRAVRGICLDQQRSISLALEQYRFENPGATVELDDLADYFNDGEVPTCPMDGGYSLSGDPPEVSCSNPDHQLN